MSAFAGQNKNKKWLISIIIRFDLHYKIIVGILITHLSLTMTLFVFILNGIYTLLYY